MAATRSSSATTKDLVLFDLSYGVTLPLPQLDRRDGPIMPPGWRRATAVQALIWRRLAYARRDHARIRRQLARPGHSVKARFPHCLAFRETARNDGDSAAVPIEQLRLQTADAHNPCWVVGRVTSPFDKAWLDVDFGNRRRLGAIRVLAGQWAFRVKAYPDAPTDLAHVRVRLLVPDGTMRLADVTVETVRDTAA